MSPELKAILARPIAHRGYHKAEDGILENTTSAIERAIAHDFPVEVDVQETADGEVLVFHDYTLDRLAEGTGRIIDHAVGELRRIGMKTGTDKLWFLGELLELIDGKVPLVIEIKSLYRRDAQAEFVKKIVDQVGNYAGPACIQSFDPDMLSIAASHNDKVIRGAVADAARPGPNYVRHSRMDRFLLRHILHAPRTRPHFVAYNIDHLPQFGPAILRKFFDRPIASWTVKTPDQVQRSRQFANQMIFEGFEPDLPGDES